jgi:hypothetical protein
MAELEPGARKKLYCNTCKVETHHELKATHSRRYDELLEQDFGDERYDADQYHYWEHTRYLFWVCCGCDTATLEEIFTQEGWSGHEATSLHPKRVTRDWLPKRFLQLDSKLSSIYSEVIQSFNTRLDILCAMGLRALLEGICAEKGITGRNLAERIDGLKDHLPSNIVGSLHGFRFMGNEAAHELQAPARGELQLAIEVIEDLLNFMYELDYKAKQLPSKKSK